MPQLLTNTRSSYGALSKFFHWTIAVFVTIMLFSFFIEDIPNKTLRGSVFNAHKLLGLTILTLMVPRLIWMLLNPKPLSLNTRAWERLIEKLVHWSLYAALIMMPIAGWTGAVTGGRPPQWGETRFNLPIAKNEWLSHWAFSIHNTLAIVIIVLVSAHILAALYHYFMRQDTVLQRMWPEAQ